MSPDGRFVYASNCGYDSIAILAVDPATGRLAQPTWEPSKGKTPRFFAFEPAGDEVKTGSPVCIVFTATS